MKLTVYGMEYECVSATKSKNEVRIIDKDGYECVFSGITNISDYVLEGGEWGVYTPPPTIETLENENDLMKAQITMQDEKQTFLEECLLEIGEVVFA